MNRPQSNLQLSKAQLLLLAAPVLTLLLMALWPLISGQQTLFLRDLFNVHLPMKAEQTRAMLDADSPGLALVGPGMAGGQPLLGNPNSVPLYPTNVLYLFTPLFWALNAHLWLHVLIAPWSFYWLGRVWGLRREGAWAAGVAYGFSGYLVSQLNFTNLVAVAALTPALIAAMLRVTEDNPPKSRGRYALFTGLLWALLLLGGEPLLAVLALALALFAVVTREGWQVATLDYWRAHWRQGTWRSTSLPLVLALGLGSLVALPQIVETLRILPVSYRGHQGYSESTRTATSLHPAQALEWLVPSFFGRMDLVRYGSFWGGRFFNEIPPFYFSLYPGLLMLALLGASGSWKRRGKSAANPSDGYTRLRVWGWTLILGGLFFALGRHNPIAEFLLGLPGFQVLRYPIKLMLPVVVGASLLAGLGFQRTFGQTSAGDSEAPGPTDKQPADAELAEDGGAYPSSSTPGWRGLRWTLGLSIGFFVVAFFVLDRMQETMFAWLRPWIPDSFPNDFVVNELERWQALSVLSLGLLVLYLALGWWSARRGKPTRSLHPAAVLALAVHAGSQLFFLQPAMPMDDVAAYTDSVPLLEVMPDHARVLHGSEDAAFEKDHIPGAYPEPTAAWQQRRVFHELYSAAGILNGLQYELNLSPEGLSSFLTRAAHDLMPQLTDAQRLQLLEAWGVQRLILNRPLTPDAAERAEQISHQRRFNVDIFVYGLPRSTPQVFHVGTILSAPHLNAAVEHLLSPTFDPTTMVVLPGDVLPGEAPPRQGPAGTVRILDQGSEHLEVEVTAPDSTKTGGALVWQRAHLPLYRATIDGEPAPIRVANLHRLAVETPPGTHVVRIETDRRPLRASLIASLVGLLGLLLLWRRAR